MVKIRDLKFDVIDNSSNILSSSHTYSRPSPIDSDIENESEGRRFTIFNEDRIDLSYKQPNASIYLDPNADPLPDTGIAGAPVFDLTQVDTSAKLDMDMELFQIKLPESIYIKLVEIAINNTYFLDKYTHEFDSALDPKSNNSGEDND